jgi:DNA modification methylase
MTVNLLEHAEITLVDISTLKPNPKNARTHSDKQIQQIANAINRFGMMNPILAQSNNEILAGHGRLEALKKLGVTQVPVIYSDHLTADEARAFMLADNKIAANAGWDKNLLSIELTYLSSIDIDLDVEITGFDTPEIDLIIDPPRPDTHDPLDDLPEMDNSPAVTKPGDIWRLGEHTLICGDATQRANYESLMCGDLADMIFTDPPYNVPIDGHVCGNGKVKHREFAMASGEMSDAEFHRFLTIVCQLMAAFSGDGSLHHICMDWRGIGKLLNAGSGVYTELKNICVWNKDNAGMGSLYRSKHELVAIFKHGTGKHCNNIELGKHGRYRTNVWDYKGVNSFGKNRSDLEMHPTVKPVALVMDAIKDCSKRGHMVLDPFAGSGTTLIAAEKTGRVARCIEFDAKYCDLIVSRWQALTGKEAWHVDSFASFNELAGGRNV